MKIKKDLTRFINLTIDNFWKKHFFGYIEYAERELKRELTKCEFNYIKTLCVINES